MPIFKIPGVKALARIPVSRMVKRRAAPLNAFRHGKLNLTPRPYYSIDELEQDRLRRISTAPVAIGVEQHVE